MGNNICKKCGINANSHLIQMQKVTHERKHCAIHNVQNNICMDCRDTVPINCLCYHKFERNLFGLKF